MVSIKISRGKFPRPRPSTNALRMLLRLTAVNSFNSESSVFLSFSCYSKSVKIHELKWGYFLSLSHILSKSLWMIGVNNQIAKPRADCSLRVKYIAWNFPSSSIEGHKIKLIPVGLVSLGSLRSRIVTARHTFAQTGK